MTDTHIFAGNPLERAPHGQRSADWLEAQRLHPDALTLLMKELDPLVVAGQAPRLAWLDRSAIDAIDAGRGGGETVLLGLLDGAPRFVTSVDALDPAGLPGQPSFVDTRTVAPLLPAAESGMLAQARSMLDWHARYGFCARCGERTATADGGARRQCPHCGARHYPRVDPSMIVLVTRAERCLLAQRPASPLLWHSCLAGFVEPGESIEDAVRREVYEETGVRVGAVRYHSSQPWPFPASLMIGCHADATSEQITVDGVEISGAAWFTRPQVLAALAGDSAELRIPQPLTIAHQLIRDWATPRE